MGEFFAWPDVAGHPACDEHFLALRRSYRALQDRGSSLKAFVSHYPRPDLPGRCFAVVAALHDLPDPFLVADESAFDDFLAFLYDKQETVGTLFEVRQVWQTAGGEPRLIEATVEVTTRFRVFREREVPARLFGDERAARITCDFLRGQHFDKYGGGTRCGLIWCDRSFGIGRLDPWSSAYRVWPNESLDRGLPTDLVAALQEFVTRF
jgi:hypothetical protein